MELSGQAQFMSHVVVLRSIHGTTWGGVREVSESVKGKFWVPKVFSLVLCLVSHDEESTQWCCFVLLFWLASSVINKWVKGWMKDETKEVKMTHISVRIISMTSWTHSFFLMLTPLSSNGMLGHWRHVFPRMWGCRKFFLCIGHAWVSTVS